MRLAVIGNGVIGLTTAIKLLRQSRDVVIYTKDKNHLQTEDTVSLVACALWQPYKLYTNLENYSEEKFDHVKNITLNSLQELYNNTIIAGSQKSGIYIRNHFEYSRESIYKEKNILKKDFYYIELLKNFWEEKLDFDSIFTEKRIKHKPTFKAKDNENNDVDFEYIHGYKTYVIDPSVFLKYLTDEFYRLGGKIIDKKLNLNEIKKLKEKVIFNCSGINGFSIIKNKNVGTNENRTLIPKKGVLLLYNLKDDYQFENTIVLDELTILCREKELTIGTGIIKEGEKPDLLINRLINNAFDFYNSPYIEKFGFDTFIQKQGINILKPSKILIGSRPYFSDGKGFVLNKENHKIKAKSAFILYNNFGHGGSGVTLCWGCANEITKLYLSNIVSELEKINTNRCSKLALDYSIELAHFDIKKLHNLPKIEIDELVKKEEERFLHIVNKLNLEDKKFSISVLIDDKEAQHDKETINKLVESLKKIDVDFIVFESKLITYINKLKTIVPEKISNEFNKHLYNHYKLSCSQDIFLWYCLRLGLIEYNFEDEVIFPISYNAINNSSSIVGNSIISFLNKGVKVYEDKADEYLSKSFGYEIASTIRRFYY